MWTWAISPRMKPKRGVWNSYLQPLAEALHAFEADLVLTESLGPVITTEFLKVKRSELGAYDLHVHPWERRMYLEAL